MNYYSHLVSRIGLVLSLIIVLLCVACNAQPDLPYQDEVDSSFYSVGELLPTKPVMRIYVAENLANVADNVIYKFLLRYKDDFSVNKNIGREKNGIEQVGKKQVDFLFIARGLTKVEANLYPLLRTTLLAKSGIVILRNPQNPIDTLTGQQVADIFSGKIRNFKEIGGKDAEISLLVPLKYQATHSVFKSEVLTLIKNNVTINSDYPENTEYMLEGSIPHAVETDPNALGIVAFWNLENRALAMKIDNIIPSQASFLNGTYPFPIPFTLIFDQNIADSANRFIKFIQEDSLIEAQDEREPLVWLEPSIQDRRFRDVMALLEYGYPAQGAENVEKNTSDKQKPSNLVRIAGSSTMEDCLQEIAKTFRIQNPEINVNVYGSNSNVGILSVKNKIAEIGMVSGELDLINDSTKDNRTYIIGYDGIAIITHPETQITDLSIDQLRSIFSGEVISYRDVNGPLRKIVVVLPPATSTLTSQFTEMVMNYSDSFGVKQTKKYIPSAQVVDSAEKIINTVKDTPGAIAFISMRYLKDYNSLVPINDVEPNWQNVLMKKYPLIRPMILFTNSELDSATRKLIEFSLSSGGQKIVSKYFATVP